MVAAYALLKGCDSVRDVRVGVNIVSRAFEEPSRQIANNAGDEGSVIVRELLSTNGNTGYNAATGKTEDLVAAGVIDPAKVTKTARFRWAARCSRGAVSSPRARRAGRWRRSSRCCRAARSSPDKDNDDRLPPGAPAVPAVRLRHWRRGGGPRLLLRRWADAHFNLPATLEVPAGRME